MFGFLKDKLKDWLGKSKSDIEIKAEKSEVKAKPEKNKAEKSKKEEKVKESKIKSEKRKRTKQELQEERTTTEKLMTDLRTEGIEIKSPEEKLEGEIDKLEIGTGTSEEEQKETKKLGFFERLKKVFSYTLTETNFEDLFSELEFSLLESNVALEVVEKIKSKLKTELVGKEIKKDKIEIAIKDSLKNAIDEILIEPENVIEQIKEHKKIAKQPYKILFFGINGAGKTTSIAKLAKLLEKNKLSCILAAADTFRAASIEQLELHGNKLGVKVIKHEYGSDPSAVAFDAIKYAETNKIDVVLIDTAGRMHTKDNLLKEMEKICRVTKPDLKVFVAEAVAGNDATEQAKAFNEMIGIDGSILSKTDVDEKGGAILSISYITKKPILFLGVGQRYEDLELFNKKKVIENLGL